MELEKKLMTIILVMAIKTINGWEYKHRKTENIWSLYFNGYYYMQRILGNSNLMTKLALELV